MLSGNPLEILQQKTYKVYKMKGNAFGYMDTELDSLKVAMEFVLEQIQKSYYKVGKVNFRTQICS